MPAHKVLPGEVSLLGGWVDPGVVAPVFSPGDFPERDDGDPAGHGRFGEGPVGVPAVVPHAPGAPHGRLLCEEPRRSDEAPQGLPFGVVRAPIVVDDDHAAVKAVGHAVPSWPGHGSGVAADGGDHHAVEQGAPDDSADFDGQCDVGALKGVGQAAAAVPPQDPGGRGTAYCWRPLDERLGRGAREVHHGLGDVPEVAALCRVEHGQEGRLGRHVVPVLVDAIELVDVAARVRRKDGLQLGKIACRDGPFPPAFSHR